MSDPKYHVAIQLPEDIIFFCEDHPIDIVAEKVASGKAMKVFQPVLDNEEARRIYQNIIFMTDVLYIHELTDE